MSPLQKCIFNKDKSIKPIWCDKCKALLRYIVNSNDKKSN